MNLSHRKAKKEDLAKLIELLSDDELGSKREGCFKQNKESYEKAFKLIDQDSNQYLMAVFEDGELVGTCHATLVPSITYMGKPRCAIEALRVFSNKRSRGIGHWIIREAINWGRANNAKIFQLTADKKRARVQKFYESLGFVHTHHGYKMFME